RVRALVIAVLEDQAAGGRTSDVIDVLVQRRPAFGPPVGQDLADHVAPGEGCSSRLLFLVCTDRAATVIVPVTSPAADTVPFPVTWQKTPLTGTSPSRSCSSAGPRISDLAIWFNWQIGAPVKRSLIAYEH